MKNPFSSPPPPAVGGQELPYFLFIGNKRQADSVYQ